MRTMDFTMLAFWSPRTAPATYGLGTLPLCPDRESLSVNLRLEMAGENDADHAILAFLVCHAVFCFDNFTEVAAPTLEELQALLAKIITRIMRLLTRQGFLIEEQDRSYLAEADRESALLPLQAASCTYRIALGPRAGQKVLSLQSVPSADRPSAPDLCAKLHGFSLHAAVR
jgi:hypothetical protein